MNRTIITIVGVGLTLVGLVAASSQTRRTPDLSQTGTTRAQLQQAQLKKTVTTQQRLNRYFHADVIPKLKNCWSSVRGKGSVELEHKYKKGPDGRWATTGVALTKSALPKGQEAIALRCMQGATRGTSFPAEGSDAATTYTIKWTWPVPFPSNAAQLTRAMFAAKPTGGGAGGGGCDGWGAPANCLTCGVKNEGCKADVCVGYTDCESSSDGSCKLQGKCASGGPFGVSGGTTIY